jgi:hypothetical protein
MLKVGDKVIVRGYVDQTGMVTGFEKPGIHTLATVQLRKKAGKFRLKNVKAVK